MQRFVSVYQPLSRSGVQTGVALGACLLMVSAVPAAATTTARPDPYAAPSTRPAAGPEVASPAAGSRPVSGKNPSAGPQFKKSGDTWKVISPDVVLKNTVTDADGDKSTVTFEVYTANADGTPKAQVNIDDSNSYGVGVSGYVASGATAQFRVAYGKLKPGVNYLVHTSAFDGSLYETTWSPWAKFRIDPYVTFPAPQQAESTIDQAEQKIVEFTRTDPGGSATSSSPSSSPAPALGDFDKKNCSTADQQDRRVCFTMTKPDKSKKDGRPEPGRTKEAPQSLNRAALDPTPGGNDAVDLVDWCTAATDGLDYMNRTEACLKDLGEGELWFFDSDPEKPAIGRATFKFEQRMKTYRNKSESGSDFGEFDQQIVIIPTYIDPALEGVTMKWNIDSSCAACDVAPIQWLDDGANPTNGAHWTYDPTGGYYGRWGTVVTRWTGSGKEQINLGWSITASVDASNSLKATADFGSSGIDSVRELAPRCDNILAVPAPGCVLPFFKPTYTVDTNAYPAAGAYYWLMQEKMPDHAGSKKWDSLLHYLGPDTTVTNPTTGSPWTSTNSRNKICGSGTTKFIPHPADASVGSTDCDEYAMASTHESGGFPGSVNQVSDGSKCAQLFTDKMAAPAATFGILADTRTAANGPAGTERCGRAGINSGQNQGAFSDLNPATWRLLDGDGFFVSNPGFEHCANANTTCSWRSRF